jgi:hypothetical protein
MCAFYFDEEMETLAKQQGLELSYIRFTMKGGFLYDDYLNLFDQILLVKPDIVVIESSFFGYKSENSIKSFVRSHIVFIKTLIKQWIMQVFPIHLTIEDDGTFDISENYFDNYKDNDKAKINVDENIDLFFDHYRKFRNLDFEYGLDFKDYFHRFNNYKIKVALIDIPMTEELVAILPKGFEDRYDSLINRYAQEYGVIHLKLPYRMESIYFKDFYHLNYKGRRMFSAWFVQQLKKFKEGKDDQNNRL